MRRRSKPTAYRKRCDKVVHRHRAAGHSVLPPNPGPHSRTSWSEREPLSSFLIPACSETPSRSSCSCCKPARKVVSSPADIFEMLLWIWRPSPRALPAPQLWTEGSIRAKFGEIWRFSHPNLFHDWFSAIQYVGGSSLV